MPTYICCFEYERLPIKAIKEASEKAITPAQAKELEALANLPRQAFVRGLNYIQWQHFCGLIQLQGLTIEILPKVYRANNHAEARHVFILEFCRLVAEQIRLGRPKAYLTEQANLGVLKGKLLVTQQIRFNLAHKEKLFCEFDEFTDDILLHQIIKYCLHLLLPQCNTQQTQQQVSQLLMQHSTISDVAISLSDLELTQAQLNRQTAGYAAILQWCEILLTGLSPVIAAGKQPLISILFDMNKLFEAWVAALLKPQLAQQGFRLKSQGGHNYLAKRKDTETQVFMTKPDLIITDSQNNLLAILDTKWKQLNPAEAKLGIQQADMYQMTSYGYLYSVNNLALIYPKPLAETATNEAASHYSLAIKNLNLEVLTLDIETNALPFSWFTKLTNKELA